MDAVRDFEIRLLELDPSRDTFALDIDRLVESIPLACQADLIPSIFRFFEKYPLEDCGAPGALVHLTEQFYPSYKGVLLDSLVRTPSYNALLMTNRVLNSSLSAHEREEYLAALRSVAARLDIAPALANQAQHFISHQNQKSSPYTMEGGWSILTTRWGVDIVSPTTAQLQGALEEMFSTKDPEHPNSWLRFGRDDGPMFVLDVHEGGTIVFEEWADTEFELELASPRQLTGATQATALRLWDLLRHGDLPAVRAADWSAER